MNDDSSLAPLHVASHVRLCACDGSVIVLDLHRSRYWNLSLSTSNALASMVRGWPRGATPCFAARASNVSGAASAPNVSPTTRTSDATAASSLLATSGTSAVDEETQSAQTTRATQAAQGLTPYLLSLGILTRSGSESLSSFPITPALEPACESLTPLNPLDRLNRMKPGTQNPIDRLDLGGRAPRTDARRLTNFLWSGTVAAWALRAATLHDIALRLAKRRERLTGVRENANSGNREPGGGALSEAMRSAALSFDRLRPLAFSARDRCLHDSLSLMGFLAAEGLCPRWVIGVKTGPFGAHSWVQAGGTVLNDQHERVRAYRPILVI